MSKHHNIRGPKLESRLQTQLMSLVRSPFLVIAARGGQYVFVLIAFVLLARQLGPAGFGLVVAAQAIANLLAPIADMGGYSLVTRDMSKGLPAGDALTPAVSTIVLLAPLLILVGTAAACLIFSPSAIWAIALILIVEILLIRLLDQLYAVNFSRKKYITNASIDIAVGLGRLLMVGALFLVQGGVLAWATTYFVGSLAILGFASCISLGNSDLPTLARISIRDRIREGLDFALSTSARSAHGEFDRILLAQLSGLETTGVFGASSRLVLVLTMPFYMYQMAKYPSFFDASNKGGYVGARRVAWRQTTYLAPAGALLSLCLFFASDWVPMLLGPGYSDAPAVVRGLSIIVFLYSIYESYGNALSGAGLQAKRRNLQLAGLGVNIGLNIILIPILGIQGTILSAIASHSLMFYLFVIWSTRYRDKQ